MINIFDLMQQIMKKPPIEISFEKLNILCGGGYRVCGSVIKFDNSAGVSATLGKFRTATLIVNHDERCIVFGYVIQKRTPKKRLTPLVSYTMESEKLCVEIIRNVDRCYIDDLNNPETLAFTVNHKTYIYPLTK